MIERDLTARLRKAAGEFPVVTLTGPRQSGESTLCKQVFPGLACANLEAPDTRAFAREDPRAFLAQFPEGTVLDEVQRAPEVPSCLQGIIDADPRPRTLRRTHVAARQLRRPRGRLRRLAAHGQGLAERARDERPPRGMRTPRLQRRQCRAPGSTDTKRRALCMTPDSSHDPAHVEELRRFTRSERFDEQPTLELDSEAVDFRAASESFAPIRNSRGATSTGLWESVDTYS